MQDIKININDLASGIYGMLLKKRLITPDEYHMLKSTKLKEKEEESNEPGSSQNNNGN